MIARLIATGLMTGYLRPAPGSWGSLLGLLIGGGLVALGGKILLFFAFLALLPAGYWAISRYMASQTQKTDPPEIVIDEIIGQILVLLFAPLEFWTYLLCFVLFRGFDIYKPWPVSWADRSLGGAFGVICDDCLAAIYVILVIILSDLARLWYFLVFATV